MGGQPSTQIDSSALASALAQKDDANNKGLTDMFDNMQISIVGGQQEEMKSEAASSENESGDEAIEDHF